MIYIISALISVFITAALILTALYLKALYYAILNDINKFIAMIVKDSDKD